MNTTYRGFEIRITASVQRRFGYLVFFEDGEVMDRSHPVFMTAQRAGKLARRSIDRQFERMQNGTD